MSRHNGLPFTVFGNFFQKHALEVVALKKSGINTLEDLGGRILGEWCCGIGDPIRYMLYQEEIEPVYAPQGFVIEPLWDGSMDSISVMSYNEKGRLMQSLNEETGELLQWEEVEVRAVAARAGPFA